MTWFKFLAAGATGPFSGYRWPPPPSLDEPGDWATSSGRLDPCRAGLHLCRDVDLPLWFDTELYEVEADGPLLEYDGFVVTARARLLRRVTGWAQGTAHRFGDACAWQVRDHAVHQLLAQGRRQEAEALASCATVAELAVAVQEQCDIDEDGSPVVGYALDAATFAGRARGDGWATAAATTGFIAATAARVAAAPGQGGDATYEERSRQARWLLAELASG